MAMKGADFIRSAFMQFGSITMATVNIFVSTSDV